MLGISIYISFFLLLEIMHATNIEHRYNVLHELGTSLLVAYTNIEREVYVTHTITVNLPNVYYNVDQS
jgi:hypothetical protein